MLLKRVNKQEFNPPPTEEEERFYSSPQPTIPVSYPLTPLQMTFLVTVTKTVEAESADSLAALLKEELDGGTLENATVEISDTSDPGEPEVTDTPSTEAETSDAGDEAPQGDAPKSKE